MFMVTVSGLVVLVVAPVQPVKVQPAAGVAVRVTACSAWERCPRRGNTVPDPTTVVVRLWVAGVPVGSSGLMGDAVLKK